MPDGAEVMAACDGVGLPVQDVKALTDAAVATSEQHRVVGACLGVVVPVRAEHLSAQ